MSCEPKATPFLKSSFYMKLESSCLLFTIKVYMFMITWTHIASFSEGEYTSSPKLEKFNTTSWAKYRILYRFAIWTKIHTNFKVL